MTAAAVRVGEETARNLARAAATGGTR